MKKTRYYNIIMVFICFILIIQNTITIYSAEKDFHAVNVFNSKKILDTRYESQNNLGGNLYSSIAFDFHIFSNEAIITAHTNGNIATNIFYGNGNGFGSNENNYLQKREDNYFGQEVHGFGNVKSNGNTILGSAIKTSVSESGSQVAIHNKENNYAFEQLENVYTQTKTSSEYIDIKKELNELATMSKTLSEKKSSIGVKLSEANGENQTINVEHSSKINYLNIKASDISDGRSKRNLHINLPTDTTLIISVDMNGVDINFLQNLVVQINNHSNSSSVIKEENGLLWNIFDSSNKNNLFVTNSFAKIGVSDYFMGTILAPKAKIAYGALNGSIIANQTRQEGKESHKWDFTGLESPDKPTPTEPAEPITPTIPFNPINPTNPAIPTNPTDPSNPAEPTNPTDPSNPTEPTNPTDPSNPTEPTNPTDPSNPAEPNNPSNPAEPTDTTDTINPDDPIDPTTPTNPDETTNTTDQTNLDETTNTTDTIKLAIPVNTSNDLKESTGVGGGLPPKTSDNFNLLLYTILFIISGIGLGCYLFVFKSKRKKCN